MNSTIKAGAKIGSVIGVIVWFMFGILTGSYFGGYGAISILSKLVGGPVEATILSRVFVVSGMAVGVMAAGTVCLVVGGLLGTLVGWVVSPKSEKQLATN